MKVVPIGDAQSATGERTAPELNVVPAMSAGERAHELQLQARALSFEHLKALEQALLQARVLSEAVVHDPDLYGPGLHEFARRLAEELLSREKTLEGLTERHRTAVK